MLLRRRLCRRGLCLVVLSCTALYACVLLVGDLRAPALTQLTELHRCPACYGVAVCPELYSNQISLDPRSLTHLFNAKNVFYGTARSGKRVVLKKLAHDWELRALDRKLCEMINRTEGCKTNDLLNIANMEEQIEKLVRFDVKSQQRQARSGLLLCPDTRALPELLRGYGLPTSTRPDRGALLNALTIILVNAEPIILQTLSGGGWAVPAWGGACGRLALAAHAGEPLSAERLAPWPLRLHYARQILKAAMDFTFIPYRQTLSGGGWAVPAWGGACGRLALAAHAGEPLSAERLAPWPLRLHYARQILKAAMDFTFIPYRQTLSGGGWAVPAWGGACGRLALAAHAGEPLSAERLAPWPLRLHYARQILKAAMDFTFIPYRQTLSGGGWAVPAWGGACGRLALAAHAGEPLSAERLAPWPLRLHYARQILKAAMDFTFIPYRQTLSGGGWAVPAWGGACGRLALAAHAGEPLSAERLAPWPLRLHYARQILKAAMDFTFIPYRQTLSGGGWAVPAWGGACGRLALAAHAGEPLSAERLAPWPLRLHYARQILKAAMDFTFIPYRQTLSGGGWAVPAWGGACGRLALAAHAGEPLSAERLAPWPLRLHYARQILKAAMDFTFIPYRQTLSGGGWAVPAWGGACGRLALAAHAGEPLSAERLAPWPLRLHYARQILKAAMDFTFIPYRQTLSGGGWAVPAWGGACGRLALAAHAGEPLSAERLAPWPLRLHYARQILKAAMDFTFIPYRQTLSGGGWAVPAWGGACGRLALAAHAGEPLSAERLAPWPLRLHYARQILKAAMDFTFIPYRQTLSGGGWAVPAWGGACGRLALAAHAGEPLSAERLAPWPLRLHYARQILKAAMDFTFIPYRQTLSGGGWAVPAWGGACGRLALAAHAGEPLSAERLAPWPLRLHYARQILKAAMDFTFKHDRFRFYLMDWSLDNIAADDHRRIAFVDLEDVIVLDKHAAPGAELPDWYMRDSRPSGPGFTFSVEGMCRHHLSDHNLWAACYVLAGDDGPLLLPIPDDVDGKWPSLSALLSECLRGGDRFRTMGRLQQVVGDILSKHVDGVR